MDKVAYYKDEIYKVAMTRALSREDAADNIVSDYLWGDNVILDEDEAAPLRKYVLNHKLLDEFRKEDLHNAYRNSTRNDAVALPLFYGGTVLGTLAGGLATKSLPGSAAGGMLGFLGGAAAGLYAHEKKRNELYGKPRYEVYGKIISDLDKKFEKQHTP